MVSKKAIVLIPGFRSGLYNFFLNSLQDKEYGFKSYEEIKNEDNSIIRQVTLDKCLLHIYELDYLEEIPEANLSEWINLLSSIYQFFYWLIPDYDWLTKFKCRDDSGSCSNKVNSRTQNFYKQRVGCTSLFQETLCKLSAYTNSFSGYPLTLIFLYIVFYFISAFYLFLVLANSFNQSPIHFLEAISKDITLRVNTFIATFLEYFCSGNSWEEINDCIEARTSVLAWISVLVWMLSAWFFFWIRF